MTWQVFHFPNFMLDDAALPLIMETSIAGEYPEFVSKFPQVQWKSMRGMRNRLAHGYFDINLDVVWETVRQAFPDLEDQLRQIQQAL